MIKKKENHFGIVFFLTQFFVIYSVLYAALLYFKAGPLQELLSRIESQLTGFTQDGFLLHGPTGTFLISEQCTGLTSGIILIALIFAGKKPSLSKKVRIAIIGLLSLLLINVVRVYVVLQVGAIFSMTLAEQVHILSWFVMTGVILALWYYLVLRVGKLDSVRDLI